MYTTLETRGEEEIQRENRKRKRKHEGKRERETQRERERERETVIGCSSLDQPPTQNKFPRR